MVKILTIQKYRLTTGQTQCKDQLYLQPEPSRCAMFETIANKSLLYISHVTLAHHIGSILVLYSHPYKTSIYQSSSHYQVIVRDNCRVLVPRVRVRSDSLATDQAVKGHASGQVIPPVSRQWTNGLCQ